MSSPFMTGEVLVVGLSGPCLATQRGAALERRGLEAAARMTRMDA
jgi:hypothetical protein